MDNIEHLGEVITIDGNIIEVTMSVNSACVSCAAKSACGSAESTDKSVFIFVEEPQLFAVGERVIVEITQAMGIKAVVYAYILPFVLLLSALLLTLKLEYSEAFAGLASLGVVGVYYVGLYLMRNKLEREIIFNLRKI